MIPDPIPVKVSHLRRSLMQQRRDIQSGKVLAVEHYRKQIGYLVTAATAAKSQPTRTLEVSIKDFRRELRNYWSAIAPTVA
ncbi:MAG: hypothetical protein HC781_21695 [Leptolyngbyaceae cyanobacterium CSU_1_4]|nr:hypothetical protein [Leptolyngbyaceae cyanobacterium CSU_1_4]